MKNHICILGFQKKQNLFLFPKKPERRKFYRVITALLFNNTHFLFVVLFCEREREKREK